MTRNPARRILLIEDNPGDVRLLCEMFKDEGPNDIQLAHVDCVSAADPLTYLSTIGLFGFIALVASALPALRASRTNPMTALKAE